MEQWWNETRATGNPGYVLSKKLKYLQGKLKAWAKQGFGRLEARILQLEAIIANFETLEQVFGLDEQEKKQRREAEKKLNEAFINENRFWS